MQLKKNSKRRHPARYESGLWTKAESQYDAGKRECRALLKALKKFKSWLYGVTFMVEIDVMTLAAQLNRSTTDLPRVLVTQQLVWIRLFDFEVRYILGAKNVMVDALSRRPATESDLEEAVREEDVDEQVAAQLGMVRLCPIRIVEVECEALRESVQSIVRVGSIRVCPVRMVSKRPRTMNRAQDRD